MKQTLSLVLAGMLGGALALGGAQLLQPTNNTTLPISNQEKITENKTAPIAKQLVNGNTTLTRPNSFELAANAAMPSVVSIKSTTQYKAKNSREERYFKYFGKPSPSESSGSGVIISDKGYIVTNNHVINDATAVKVTLYDNRTFDAEVVGTDPSTDLAVLKINPEGTIPVIELADSDEAKVGEWVLAVGNPYDLNSTVTAGIISAKGRDISILSGQSSIESFIQTDAAVNPGNSGGALVNADGDLIGINTAIYAPSGTYAGYSFAVPINLVKKVMQDLIDYGEVKRGFLGIMIQDVNSDMAKNLNLTVNNGVYVSDLIDGGAAKASGIQIGDVITKVNDRSTNSVSKLQEQIGSRNPGESVVVTVNRAGKYQDISVQLTE
jgi:Do/DeqQ family serine protease